MADFLGEKYVTAGVSRTLSPLLQLFLWHLVERKRETGGLDYLQVFELNPGKGSGEVVVRHSQEVPSFQYECSIIGAYPVTAKVYIIDNGDGTAIMLLTDEY